MQDYVFEILKEMRSECSDWQRRGLTISNIGIAQFIKDIPILENKNNSVIVEYEENGYCQNGERCNCSVDSHKSCYIVNFKPKLINENIIIVR